MPASTDRFLELLADWRETNPGEHPAPDVLCDLRVMADHEVAIVVHDTLDLAYGRFGFEPVEAP